MSMPEFSAEPQPYVRMLRELAELEPNAVQLTCGDESVTRAELDARSNRLARAYEKLGVGFGDFVTLALPNSIEFFESLIAIWKLGAVPAPVSYRLPAGELQAIIELANPKLVVGITEGVPEGRLAIAAGFEPDDALDDGPLPEVVSPAAKAPTSGGSTGRPKLIVAGTRAEAPNVAGMAFHMQFGDTQLLPGPLYHNAPLVMATAGLMMGHHVVVLKKFDAVAALEAIKTHHVDWVNLVPTMMARMWRAIEAEPDRYDLSSLRIVWHMAAPCADWLKEAWIGLVGADKLWELYGGTESQAITTIVGTDWLAHRGSVGRPFMGEMKILDANGNVAPPGEVGEIYMRRAPGTDPTYRYIGAEAKEVDGWESLGDLGWMDEDGYLYMSDRRTDMIVAGGANIYPAEVEAAIDSHPDVLSSVVVGLPDDDLGQKAHALVQARNGLTEDVLLGYLADKLVRYKIPRSVEFIDEPMRDDAGKVRRSAMRDAAIERLGIVTR